MSDDYAAAAAIASPDASTLDGRELMEVLGRLEGRLERIEEKLEAAEMRADSFAELSEDLMPMVNGLYGKASAKLSQLERDGVLDFGREGLKILETVATSFDEQDVRLLGKNVVGILRTVRNLTQPDVLDVADRAAGALTEEPAGKVRLVRSMRDPDVRRGMNILIRVLREIGQEHETKPEDVAKPTHSDDTD